MSLKICDKFRPKIFLDLKNCFYTKVYRIKFWIQTRIDFFLPKPKTQRDCPNTKKENALITLEGCYWWPSYSPARRPSWSWPRQSSASSACSRTPSRPWCPATPRSRPRPLPSRPWRPHSPASSGTTAGHTPGWCQRCVMPFKQLKSKWNQLYYQLTTFGNLNALFSI